MKIIGLQIEGIRKINAFNMEFDENGLIQIRGRNEQGKSTIIDAVEMLIRGKKFTPDDVITHGQTKGRMIGLLGDYKIERIIDVNGKNTVKVSGPDGKQVTTKPQSFLDTFVNELTFNPKPFIDKTSDQKLKFMMELLKIDFSSIDSELSEKETERTLVGREVKAFGDLPILNKVEPVDVTALMAEKEKANTKNSNIDRGVEMKTTIDDQITNLHTDIKELENKLKLKKMELEERETKFKDVEEALLKLGDKVDTTELDNQIANASETNQKAAAYQANEQKKQEKQSKENEYQALTEHINGLRSKKDEMLKAAPMPVEGLEIREDGVYFKDIHCDNWSDSQSIKVSFDLCVAMKPELKAVFIDRGESFDQDQLANLDNWAKKNDIQAFITIVDSGNPGDVENAIYIEEGNVIS